MRKKILIINRDQFGYHIDTYYYCKYLHADFDINYLCFYADKVIVLEPGVTVKYLNRNGSKLRRFLRFIRAVILEVQGGSYDVVFVRYFPGSCLLSLWQIKMPMILDVRTGSVVSSKFRRNISDWILRFELKFYKNITVISEGLAKRLRLCRYTVLPLGGNCFSNSPKNFKRLDLLYVGTLSFRKIEQTIIGLKKFFSESVVEVPVTYTIVGSGLHNEDKMLQDLIRSLDLEQVITLEGYVPQQELAKYFENCNIGVSFVPITEFFDCQPPTKTYEYILSGLVTIGTKTSENCKIINYNNGVLISDTSDSFSVGLTYIYQHLHTYSAASIRSSLHGFSWREIVSDILVPYLVTFDE